MYFLIGTPSVESAQAIANHSSGAPLPLLSGGAFLSSPLSAPPPNLVGLVSVCATITGQSNVYNENQGFAECLVSLKLDGVDPPKDFTPYFRLAVDPMRSRSTRFFLRSVYDALHGSTLLYSVNWVEDLDQSLEKLFNAEAHSQLSKNAF